MTDQPQQNDAPLPQEDLRDTINRAFDYRGDVTVTTTDGRAVEGYVFDRREEGPDACIRMIPKDSSERLVIRYDQIERIDFTGRDTAAGKSWETWVKKYKEKKAKGEQANLEPEPLDEP